MIPLTPLDMREGVNYRKLVLVSNKRELRQVISALATFPEAWKGDKPIVTIEGLSKARPWSLIVDVRARLAFAFRNHSPEHMLGPGLVRNLSKIRYRFINARGELVFLAPSFFGDPVRETGLHPEHARWSKGGTLSALHVRFGLYRSAPP